MASGEVVASFALTEPGAGSNPSGLRTKAVRDGDDWVINGRQALHHQRADRRSVRRLRAHQAGRRQRPGHRGLPGARGRRGRSRSASRTPRWARRARGPPTSASPTSGSPAAALIGGSEDIGYRAAMTSLARGRVHIAALAVGDRATRAGRIRRLCRHRDAGRDADREASSWCRRCSPTSRPACWPAAHWSATPPDCGSPAKTAGSHRRRRSCSAPKWQAR